MDGAISSGGCWAREALSRRPAAGSNRGDPESFKDGIRDDSAAARSLADLAESMAAQGDVDLALKLLSSASLRCFWAHADERSRPRVVTVAEGPPSTIWTGGG